MEDLNDNFTRFIILKKGKRVVSKIKGNELMCPMFICPSSDRAGILFEILKTFAELNLNLTSIMSRPTKKKFGTYNFYLEVRTSSSNYDIMLEAIIKLKKNYDIKVLNLAKHIGFPIIGLSEDSFDKEFDELINLNTENYKIPNFDFPKI